MASPDLSKVHKLMVEQVKHRIFNESVPRIKKCLAQLSEQEVWWRPNVQTVSVGNLVLHLCGNVRQWVLSGLGGQPDNRKRQQEFNEEGPIPKAALIEQLDGLQKEVTECLNQLPAECLAKTYWVQGYNETGLSILMHVTEHFSYHTGQITFMVKSTKNVDMQYYTGQNLDQTAS